jgi:hypothetical protein
LERAFTSKYNGIAAELINDVYISEPFTPDFTKSLDQSGHQLHQVKALWDTGATNCVVKSALVQRLNLIPISMARVRHGGGEDDRRVFLINLFLPNGFAIPFVRVTEAPDVVGNFDIIIGMDIINLGDFSITNLGGKTIFTFRMPSKKTIDYVEEINAINSVAKSPIKHSEKRGRNDLCYCGSGKKYKYCHGK